MKKKHQEDINDLIIEFALSKGIDPYLGKYKLSTVIQNDDTLIEQGLQELEGWQSEFKSVFLEVAVNAPTFLQDHPIPGEYKPLEPQDAELSEVILYYEERFGEIIGTED